MMYDAAASCCRLLFGSLEIDVLRSQIIIKDEWMWEGMRAIECVLSEWEEFQVFIMHGKRTDSANARVHDTPTLR